MHVACLPAFFPVNLTDPSRSEGVGACLQGDVAKW